MIRRCPRCRTRVPWSRTLSIAGGRWPCDACGAPLDRDPTLVGFATAGACAFALVAGAWCLVIWPPAAFGILGAFVLLLPVVWIAAERAALAPGADRNCVVCNYDLTGNTTGTCPECGARIER